MGKKCFCFLILFVLFFSNVLVNAEETFTRHFAENAALSMEIPDGWIIERAKDQYGVFDARDPHELRYIIVSDQFFDEQDGLDERFQLFLDEVSTYEWNFQIVDKGTARIGNHQSKWVIHTKDSDEKKMKCINYIVVLGNHEYIIGGFSFAERFDKNRPLLERIIKSTQIER